MTATDVTAWLDRLEAAHKAATPGPWIADSHEIYQAIPGIPDISGEWIGETCRIDGDPLGPGDADAAEIVAAHNALPALIAAVRRVLALAEELDLRATSAWCGPAPYDRGYNAGIHDGERYAADRLRAVVAAATEGAIR